MVHSPLEKGRIVSGYVQYDTIQRLQSSYVNVFDTIPEVVLYPTILRMIGGDPSSVQITLWILCPFKISSLVYCVEWESSFNITYPLL